MLYPVKWCKQTSQKKRKKEKEKEKFSWKSFVFVRKTDVFSQTVEQQIAVPERELMRVN